VSTTTGRTCIAALAVLLSKIRSGVILLSLALFVSPRSGSYLRPRNAKQFLSQGVRMNWIRSTGSSKLIDVSHSTFPLNEIQPYMSSCVLKFSTTPNGRCARTGLVMRIGESERKWSVARFANPSSFEGASPAALVGFDLFRCSQRQVIESLLYDRDISRVTSVRINIECSVDPLLDRASDDGE